MSIERWLYVVRLRLRSLFRGRAVDADLDEELSGHIAFEIDRRVAAGATPETARTETLRALGGAQQRKEECRDARGFTLLQSFVRDLRFATRMLRRRPGFSVVAILTLALGIGANTAIFAVVNGVLLQPLPFPEPERLVLLSSTRSDPLFGRALGLSESQFLDFRKGNTVFENVTTFAARSAVLIGAGDPSRIPVATVTPEFFDVFRVPAALGRTLGPADNDASQNRTVVISDGLWRASFQASRDAVGRIIKIDGVDHEVVGVMPPDFSFPDRPGAWTPLSIQVQQGNSWTRPVVGRLRPGASVQQAHGELEALAPAPERATTPPWQTSVQPLNERAVGQIRTPLVVLAAGVAFVLLISCANVMNLFLVRMAERERELTVRRALGASRRRLLQQLVAESGLVAALGTAAGLLLATLSLPALLALAPAGTIPRVELVRIDAMVLLFSAGLATLTALAFGVLPAFRNAGRNISLATSHRGHTERHERLQSSLIVAEVALSLVLLVGAGLMLRSFLRLSAVETGFSAEGVVTATVDLPRSTFRTAPDARMFHARVLSGLTPLSGVAAAGAVNWLPFGLMSLDGGLALDGGRPVPARYQVDKPGVSAGYFAAMGIRVLSGRVFADSDGPSSEGVAVVSRSVAAELWPGEDPLGRRLSLRTPPKAPEDWLTVIGVVDDVRQQSLTGDRSRAVYQSYLQVQQADFLTHMTYVVRTDRPQSAVLPGMRTVMHAADPMLPVPSLVPMSSLLASRTAAPAFQARLLSIFAFVALTLTVVGIYGVLAYSVSQRTREFGIRVALGAERASVLQLVIRKALILTVGGIAIGSTAALALTQSLDRLLFEVTPTDPGTFAVVTAIILVAALAAAAIPAWRATRVDPTIALRAE